MRTITIRYSSSVAALAFGMLFAASPIAAQPTDSTQELPVCEPDQTENCRPAGAPTEAPEAAQADQASEGTIVVTGSRIRRPQEFTQPNPVQAYTAETIQQAGVTNLTDFLIDSPALQGSTTNLDVAGSNLPSAQFVGVNLLDLRNLGEERTLVLVNGRRHIAGFPGIASVDINTIPVDLIDRIDILTGGTSAVYGADGVSGVVNFIMKRDFEGLAVRAQAGISQRGDSGNRFISAVWGKNFADDKGNIALSYEYNKLDRFSQRKRLNYGKTGPTFRFVRNPADIPDDPNIPDQVPLTGLRWLDSSPGGAVDLDLDYYPDFTGEGTPYDRGIPVAGSPFTIGGDSTPQESYFGDYTPYSRRHIFNAFGHYEFSPAFRLFAEGKYVRAAGYTLAQPTFDFFDFISPDNFFLIDRYGPDAAPDGAFITGRDNFDFGIRRYSTKRKTIRTVIGADGDITDNLRYELSYTFGQVNSTGTNQGDRITDRYFAAMDAVEDPNNPGTATCRINLPGETEIQVPFTATANYLGGAPATFQPGECVPINLFGEGSPSQEALDWILATHTEKARIRHHVVSGFLSGDTDGFLRLPGGPIGFALGAEYRKESSRTVPSELSQTLIPHGDPADEQTTGALIDNAFASIEDGSFSVKEAFGEVKVPILKDVPFAQTLEVGGAIRFSDYTTIGSTTTWTLNALYSPVRDITFRGTYSQAVRAPNVTELFAGATGTFEFIADPCGIDRLTSGTSTRAANCAEILTALGIDPTTFDPANDPTSPQNSSIQGRTSGNRDLGEETAKTWTAGVVLQPRFIPGLNLALDWYDIKLEDAVNTPAAQEVVELCVDQPTIDNVFCAGVDRDPDTGFVQTFRVLPQNVASFDTEGLDVALNYRFAPFANFGTFNLKVNGNYLHKLEFVPTPGAEVDDDRTEVGAPKFSATGDLTWKKGPLTINYGINWFSKTRRSVKELTDANPDRFEKRYKWFKEYWEHQVQVSYDVTDRFNAYVGVNNLFDTKPDVGALAYPISAIGRFFYAGVRVKAF